MGWIVQAYEGEAHVVPDTEPGHVLSWECWCDPVRKDAVAVWTHRDELDREVSP